MEGRVGVERYSVTKVDSGIGNAGWGVKRREEPLAKIKSQAQQLAIVLEPIWPPDRGELQQVVMLRRLGGCRVVPSDGKLSNGKQMRAQKATNASDDRFKDLDLAVEIEARCPDPLAGWPLAAVSVVFDEIGDTSLEITESLRAGT